MPPRAELILILDDPDSARRRFREPRLCPHGSLAAELAGLKAAIAEREAAAHALQLEAATLREQAEASAEQSEETAVRSVAWWWLTAEAVPRINSRVTTGARGMCRVHRLLRLVLDCMAITLDVSHDTE